MTFKLEETLSIWEKISKLTLEQKLSLIRLELEGGVPKDGYNEYHKYAYISHESLSNTLRKLLGKYGVDLRHEVQGEPGLSYTDAANGQKSSVLAEVKLTYTLVNAHNPEEKIVVFNNPGMAIESPIGDKVIAKALTNAKKLFLLNYFLIGDNSEDIDSTEHNEGKEELRSNNGSYKYPGARSGASNSKPGGNVSQFKQSGAGASNNKPAPAPVPASSNGNGALMDHGAPTPPAPEWAPARKAIVLSQQYATSSLIVWDEIDAEFKELESSGALDKESVDWLKKKRTEAFRAKPKDAQEDYIAAKNGKAR